jgi:pimeloyl-ACP methyl ester carboxylesterase
MDVRGACAPADVAMLVVAGALVLDTAASAHTPPAQTSGGVGGQRVELPGGRGIYLECRGRGNPTVMLEGGLREGADVWSTPKEPTQPEPTVLRALARVIRVCVYDRPGMVLDEGRFSRSDPVRMPRATGALVADLRALQGAAHIRGPYVLVGHSMGGLIDRQYTSLYPSSVCGA